MKNKIAFVGGDKRMFYCAEALCSYGLECALYGFDGISDRASSTRCPSLYDCIVNSDSVILPVPISKDGITVRSESGTIMLSSVFEAVKGEVPIYAGAVNEKVECVASTYGHTVTDFLLDDALCEKNAYLTAEGAVSLAMKSRDTSVYGSVCLVTGYGRIGTYTARLLKSLGATVLVYARKELSRVKATLDGHIAVSPEQLPTAVGNADIIFNTVPARILGERETAHLKSDKTYIELASSPGGIDKSLADKANLEITDGSALPSRYCPRRAGEYIAEYLKKEFEGMGML